MTTITSSLERSLQNCSLNHSNNSNSNSNSNSHRRGSGDFKSGVKGKSSSSNSSDVTNFHTQCHLESASSSSDDNSTFVELNSHVSLPYHWEQCLDLKTGELYYVNWSTGRKAKEDPRTSGTGYNGDYYSEDSNDNDSEEEEEESSRCDSEESSSCWSSRESLRSMSERRHQHKQQQELKQEAVLVVAGCNSCFMYYMLPKDVHQCPKCCANLLHFPPN